ncbi:PfkB family carbohydrate kinase [Luteipulveratus sp. YIM 133132]|uniref:PfkB family carbohydrate kinase n=1 Tax=Luteipulveratus flavus TaxID=3031728 RepID=A0ABT6C667_9MICO|nr:MULTISPECIES: PfkB family carbohydrate kinase [unclassified Luteipulveratus]MDE9366445.1 PfkB family carbohydrate kinase [Luteipulveratus sp. YIM 133132]MDF8264280.1 PfkB family carbohydrate kinase [Luteipulveratus sp. YIM 133296]
MSRVVHTGQALVDVVVDVPGLPRRGGNAMATSYERYAGGSVNVLVAAARTGAEAVHAGSVGRGPNGDLVRQTLDAEKVRLATDPVEGEDTGICFVMIEPSAERTFVTTQGAERRITPASLDRCAPQDGDLVCVTGYTLLGETCAPLLDWLESLTADVVVVLDPSAPFAQLPDDVRDRMLAVTDVWTSNAQEAQELTGADSIEASVESVADRLGKSAVVIVRDGPKGCHLREAGRITYLSGYPQHPVDTNGAGDAHTGVLTAERALGADWTTAATRANAAGAIKVTRKGPATAPTRAEVDAFLARQPAR